MDAGTAETRLLTRGLRILLVIAAGLVFAAGVQLFVFPERTDRYFAWTIPVPLTAAFLGAGYWASVVFELLAVRGRVWAQARMVIPAVFVFTVLTLVATLMHLDLFHLDPSLPAPTRAVTWLWIAVYAGVPVAMVVLVVGQLRAPGEDPPRERPFPAWLRVAVAAQAGVLASVGVLLFAVPAEGAGLWPWPLTPLTARAVAAWVLGMAVGMVHGLVENDLRRARVALIPYAAFGFLELVALARYPDTPEWDGPVAWVYVAFLVAMVGIGVYGSIAASRAPVRRARPASR